MNKQLVITLLRIFHSDETRFDAGKGLREFCETYNIGRKKGASLLFSERDKTEIASILKGGAGIDASTTRPDSWDGLTRAESLCLGRNEKLAGGVVAKGRVQLKALRGHDLSVCGKLFLLPDTADLGLDLEVVMEDATGHDSILLIENKETFNDVWRVREDLLNCVSGTNPLVVFRGDANGGSRADAVHRLIALLDLPVFAFVDFDPAGMVIASALPRLDAMVSPGLSELKAMVREHGLVERFMMQVAAAKVSLERLESHPAIGPVWNVIRNEGKGLPQEAFHCIRL